jgi:hypothetical protein
VKYGRGNPRIEYTEETAAVANAVLDELMMKTFGYRMANVS